MMQAKESRLSRDVRLKQVCTELTSLGGSICAKALEASESLIKGGILNKAAMQADLVLDITWEKLHTGPWKDVDTAWRNAYSLAALLSVRCQKLTLEGVPEAMRALDLAVMMGGPMFRPDVDTMISRLQSVAAERGDSQDAQNEGLPDWTSTEQGAEPVRSRVGSGTGRDAGERTQVDTPEGTSSSYAFFRNTEQEREDNLGNSQTANTKGQKKDTGSGGRLQEARDLRPVRNKNGGDRTDHDRHPKRAKFTLPEIGLPPGSQIKPQIIPRRHMPSLESFFCEHMLGERPVILTGVVSEWPAFAKWRDLGYLKRVAGLRTVPVEVGETYVAEKWRQELMTMETFIEMHMEGGMGAEERGYLAQHPLFEQIPELRNDFSTPDYCNLGGGEMQSVNAWFGPPGTVTPLHYDPHHNLLAQVVGQKYIRLYRPSMSHSVYPHTEGMLTNTSRVDLDRPNEEEFPLFVNTPFVDCVLDPGEMLYIPPRWWHYVKALTQSFSVSFWWAAGEVE